MALDFCVYGEAGRLLEHVGLGVDAHWRLFQAAEFHRLKLLARIHDYYADSTYEVRELPSLLQELAELNDASKADAELVNIVANLTALVTAAMRTGSRVVVEAD